MSSNRLIYDIETFSERTKGNKSQLEYTEYKGKYEHNFRCGKDLSMGDMADISSELLGITRTASKCAAKDWNPKIYDYKVHDKKYTPPDACNVTFGHIQACKPSTKMPTDSGLDPMEKVEEEAKAE